MTDRVLSLFSGAGGLSSGFGSAGLMPCGAFELDTDACNTYRLNLDDRCVQADLNGVDAAQIRKHLPGGELFAVIGGPPCQGFSTAGARDSDDPRNRLILRHLSIVAELCPRWFLFENVEGLLTSGGGADVSQLVAEFLRIGYSLRLQKANFAGYGLPQTRKRVLLVGNRLGMDFVMPAETHCYDSGKVRKKSGKPSAPTLAEALHGLGASTSSRETRVPYCGDAALSDYDRAMRVGNGRADVSLHHQTVRATELPRLRQLRPGQTMKDLPVDLQHASFARRANRRVMDGTPTEKRGGAPSGVKRLIGDYNSLTITSASTREFIHPGEDRPLTLRECARLQSFPDRYEFCGNAGSIARQIGNAVPPMVATVLARHLMMLDGRLGSGTCATKVHRTPRLLGFQLTDSSGMSPALQRTFERLQRLQQPTAFA